MYFVDREKMEQTLAYIEENITIYSSHQTWDTPVEKKALERIMVSVIEGILDVGNAMIDGFIMRDPGSYEDIIDILEDEKVVPASLAGQLKVLVRLRKTLVQEYLDIDHQDLKTKISEGKDAVMSFCSSVRHYLENELGPVSAFKK
ncbi:uncharacterized protein YutE (UPF0331/DUF86 family) [Bacillus tianshenii]|uniref:Uncharacterized protein YutE (UPF0331/DUF86 family) n=1 Tax=Sutcliffiella tianshenii TaxID=1463404 RepID=A0ABS2P4N6_9BACI|nr:DUF86 domain-containing protein [Bacillus tianshenii]MBM7621829.1 uncharacterized protein YutE (UPF0331/DUF86 family) [Bacillus tianshenii]